MVERGVRVMLPSEFSRADCIGFAELADEEGIDTIWIPETWGRNSVILMTQVAERISSSAICSGIFNVYSRSPGLVAMTAAGIADVAETNVRIGLGASGPTVVEDFHGCAFEEPLRRTHEFIEILRTFLSGDTANYDGAVFELSGFSLTPPVEYDIPIYNAAMGDANLRLTGEYADGWLPLLVPLDGFAESIDSVEVGTERAGRSIDDVDIAPYITTCISDDEPERARDIARGNIAFYVCAMGDFYYNSVRSHGYREETERMREAWQAGDRDRARSAVTDEMLDAFAISGDSEQAQSLFHRYVDAGVDMPIAYIPPSTPDAFVRTTIQKFARL